MGTGGNHHSIQLCIMGNTVKFWFHFVLLQINMVFDGLQATRDYNGYIFFLEEDHYVAPDFIQVARQLIKIKEKECTDCDFINLGMYNKVKSLDNRVMFSLTALG